jgi:tellurite resistance protein
MKRVLEERRRALENQFFEKENARLLAAFQEHESQDEDRAELARRCGLPSGPLGDKLMDVGVRAESLTALIVLPLVAVAWADSKVTPPERSAVLAKAEEFGIVDGSPAQALLTRWLDRRPPSALLEAWHDYVTALSDQLETPDSESLAEHLVDAARSVAAADGGFLGIGPKTSADERAVLAQIARAFDETSADR